MLGNRAHVGVPPGPRGCLANTRDSRWPVDQGGRYSPCENFSSLMGRLFPDYKFCAFLNGKRKFSLAVDSPRIVRCDSSLRCRELAQMAREPHTSDARPRDPERHPTTRGPKLPRFWSH
jgi:hypothetical protein